MPVFASPLISLTELKTHLDYPNPTQASNDDTALQGFLDAAFEVAAFYVGPLTLTSYTETHYGVASDRVVVDHTPVVSVDSVSDLRYLGMAPIVYDPTTLTVDNVEGVIRVTRGVALPGDVTVTYTAGPATFSRAVRLGVLELATHWWRRSQEATMANGGGGAIGNAYDQPDLMPGPMAGVPYSVLDKFRTAARPQGIG